MKKLCCFTLLTLVSTIFCETSKIRLPDETVGNEQPTDERRNGKHLLDFVDYVTTGLQTDPLISKARNFCFKGEMSECFRAQALDSFNDFFHANEQRVSEAVRILKLPENQLRTLENEPYEYVGEPKSTDSDWEELVKFALRKMERFVKTRAFEVEIPNELQADENLSPRFLNEIDDEIDVIEDKKAPLFIKHRLKKMFIPMLLILKLFKLKLLLFLPFIIGIAGFKKVLGFLAFVVPGIIGYLKFCRPPIVAGGLFNKNNYSPQYNQQGLGTGYNNLYDPIAQQQSFFHSSSGYRNSQEGVRFDDDSINPQNLAYSGYSEFRNTNSTVAAQ